MDNNFLIVLILSFVAGFSTDDPEVEHLKLLEKLTMTRTSIETGYQLVSRHSGVRVHRYRNYRSVSFLYFEMPADTAEGRFNFIGEEVQLNSIGKCSPRHLIVDLQRGAFPVSTPDGYPLPKNYMNFSSRAFNKTVDLETDGTNHTFIILSPEMGDWYGMAYLAWQDPNSAQVSQQGLVPNCQAALYVDLQVKIEENTHVINCYSEGISVEYELLPRMFKCATYDSNQPISLRITINNTPADQNVEIQIQANQIPRSYNSMISCIFDPRDVTAQVIKFQPHVNKWHYIHLRPVLSGGAQNISSCSLLNTSEEYQIENSSITKLLIREPRSRAFSYDFSLPHTDITDSTSEVNVTSDSVTHLRFDIDQFVNTGGTIIIEAVVTMKLKYYMGFTSDTRRAFSNEEPYFKIVVCRGLHHITTPLPSGLCLFNNKTTPALFVLNSTDGESIHKNVFVPYPESGIWFVSMKLFTDTTMCPCRTSHNGTKYYVATEKELPSKDIEELGDTMWAGNKSANATVMLSVRSRPCGDGKCNDQGSCMLNSATGLIASYCYCWEGYGAWDCSDTSRLSTTLYLQTAVLLLTLSNLLFIISVYVAVIRNYYVEAAVYCFPLIFSTFYHACDAAEQVAYCIIDGQVLQFGDFFSGLMAFWFTLLAMSTLPDKFLNVFRLFGVIFIAFLTYWDMHSFLAFLLPVAVGIVTVIVTWSFDYYSDHKMLYKKSYYLIYLPIGFVLVSFGLICYGFLQTENNYKFVHSFWHVVIAVSVVFLLPDTREGVRPFAPTGNWKCWQKVRGLLH